MGMFIRKGDKVRVISGNDKGATGKVLEVYPETNKAIVEGINIAHNFKKPRSAQDKGGIIKKEAPIDASKLMIVCPACEKASRVRHMIDESGKKFRICECGAKIEVEVTDAKKKGKKEEKPKKATKAKKSDSAKKAEPKEKKAAKEEN